MFDVARLAYITASFLAFQGLAPDQKRRHAPPPFSRLDLMDILFLSPYMSPSRNECISRSHLHVVF